MVFMFVCFLSDCVFAALYSQQEGPASGPEDTGEHKALLDIILCSDSKVVIMVTLDKKKINSSYFVSPKRVCRTSSSLREGSCNWGTLESPRSSRRQTRLPTQLPELLTTWLQRSAAHSHTRSSLTSGP